MIFRKLFSNWPFDNDNRSFSLNGPDTHEEHHVLIRTSDGVLPIAHPPGFHLIVSRFALDDSTVRDLTPEEWSVVLDDSATKKHRLEVDACLCLLRIDVPAHIHWNPFSKVMDVHHGADENVSIQSDEKFIRIGEPRSPVGIIFQLKKYGAIFIYETVSNMNHCITYDGEFLFFSGEKVRILG
ncbi:MAG: hypothetical protein HGA31_01955 [Candidatus Moranbacteria bacterium]|nr:hypothetical protein [Candidatus Moranbacteria bacterium]